jgi:5-methylthioribose kinase
MLELTPENTLDYLRSRGWIGPGPARVEALSWGVSNAVFRVEAEGRLFVLKQSRPQLRTKAAWFSNVDRIYREQEVMEFLHPLLPAGTVPRVLFSDRDNYAFAMEHAPVEARVWKECLLAGEIDLRLGEQVGFILGRMHEATAGRPQDMERFADHTVFVQLRVNPFYRRIQERHPDLASPIEPIIQQMLTVKEALCMGDFSPKNILTHDRAFTLVDYEAAHFGEPTMDLGFFLSHLILKAVKRHGERQRLFDLTRAFWTGYRQEVQVRPAAELEERTLGHFAVCALARIDGTSPVDYLTEERQRDAVRQLGRQVLQQRPPRWEEVLALAEKHLRTLESS